MGGIDGALSRRAEEVFASLPAAVQDVLPKVFSALTQLGITEASVSRKYVALDSTTSAEMSAFLDAFIASRLFIADRADDGTAVVSVAHDALFRAWPRLHNWLAENRDLLRVRTRVAAAAEYWAERGRVPDLLLAEGKPLEEAEPLVQSPAVAISTKEKAFIVASQARARSRRRARQLMNLNSVVLLIGGAAVITLYLWKIVPMGVEFFEAINESLFLPIRIQILLSKIVVQLSPFILAAIIVLYIFRKKITWPEFITSGMALAISTGVLLLFNLFCYLARPVAASKLGIRLAARGQPSAVSRQPSLSAFSFCTSTVSMRLSSTACPVSRS